MANAENTAIREIMNDIMLQTTLPRLYERDIDVLLQEELIFNSNVANFFANALHLDQLRVHECILSVVELDGETDVQAATPVATTQAFC